MLESSIKVLYIHGGNSRSQEDQTLGPIASFLKEQSPRLDVQVPKMNTSFYEACFKLQCRTLSEFQPHIVVGESLFFLCLTTVEGFLACQVTLSEEQCWLSCYKR